MFDLAIWYRTAGGFLGLGSTFLCRLRWAIIMAVYMVVLAVSHHMEWWQVLVVAVGSTVGAFFGRLIPHARFQATASLGNSLGMAVVNVLRLALIVAPYAFFEPIRACLVAFGVLAGVAYYVGWKYLDGRDSGIYYRNNHKQWRISCDGVGTVVPGEGLDQAAVGGSEWGELLTGFLTYELMFICALVLP